MLIPRDVLFSDPDKIQIKLSPNGQYLSYLAPHQGNLNLWLAPFKAFEKAFPVSNSEHPLRDYWWHASNDWLIYSHDYAGDENWQLYGYQLSTGKTLTYTGRGCQARILRIGKENSTTILIALNERDKHYHDVYMLNIETGEKECILENNEYWDFIGDGDFRCRLGIKIHAHFGEYVDLSTGCSISKVPQHDLFGLYFYPRLKPVFGRDNNTLYIVQSCSTNTSSLVAMDLNNKTSTVLAHRNEADICDVLYHPQTKVPIAYAINYKQKEWFGLNHDTTLLLDYLKDKTSAEINIVNQNVDQWIVSFSFSDKPTEYYCYEHKDKTLTFLCLSHDSFKGYDFNSMEAVEISMQDGTTCLSYLSLPKDATLPVPLVMIIHGGPNSRDVWGFNPYHQWLTNRGYAALSVNFRASTGFGRMHSEAGNGEWAGKIREDIMEAADWAIQKGITTENTVALLGRSFGGYQVLAGLSYTPEKYCCGIDIVGPANLETMIKCFPPYWKSMQGILNDVIGADANTPEGKLFLKENSPLTYADKIKRPLLIGHGMNDPRISRAESDQMVAAMQANQVPVTYVVFSNEGHQLSHAPNRMAFYGLVEAFLHKNLGAKMEPYEGASLDTMHIKVDDFNLI